jgi:zinc/manganese transport system permease protein
MSGMSDALALLALPFAASVVFVLMHAYLGVHVLRRRIVFADLALAQLSALGATVAFASGYPATSAAGFGYALLFTAIGAALLTLTRSLARHVSQEAFVGIVYVVATAATILVVDRAPQGAEHVKKILIGSILTVEPADVAKFAVLYAVIGFFHWLARRPLLALSDQASSAGRTRLAVWICDFAFYLSFAIVVTSSVTTAGVLLVFSLLIVPAVIGSIFSGKLSVVLLIAWSVGIVASAVGLAGSYALDLPTGAAMVTAQAGFLLLAGLAKVLLFVDSQRRRRNLRIAATSIAAAILVTLLASSVWLMTVPTGDQPLLAVVESATGIGPTQFLRPSERDAYQSATRDALRFQGEVDRLNAMEKAARYQGTPLSDDDIRRIASYQKTFNEMARGERFVQEVLRSKTQVRARWIVGVPGALIAIAGLLWFTRRHWNGHWWGRHRLPGTTQPPASGNSPSRRN